MIKAQNMHGHSIILGCTSGRTIANSLSLYYTLTAGTPNATPHGLGQYATAQWYLEKTRVRIELMLDPFVVLFHQSWLGSSEDRIVPGIQELHDFQIPTGGGGVSVPGPMKP